MILSFDLISLAAAFIGLYYMSRVATAVHGYDKWEIVGSGFLLAIISVLAFAASYVGMVK